MPSLAPYNKRTLIRHSPQIADVPLDTEEMVAMGRELGRRLQADQDTGRFHDPRGIRQLRREGEGFYVPPPMRHSSE